MSNTVFSLDKFTDLSTKINIDELFEKKRAREAQQTALFQKILNRVHTRIKQCSRGFKPQTFCWFTLPNMVIGTANYDSAACIAYIIHHLQENDFLVKYYSPDALLINWGHWMPSYIRAEIKKATGIEVDKFGNPIPIYEDESEPEHDANDPRYARDRDRTASSRMSVSALKSSVSAPAPAKKTAQKKEFVPLEPYKSTANLIYSTEMLDTKLDLDAVARL